jgi:hypothetical protein
MALIRMCDNKLTTTNEVLAERISSLEDRLAMGNFTPASLPSTKKEAPQSAPEENSAKEPATAEEPTKKEEPVYVKKDEKRVLKQLNSWPEIVKKFSKTDPSTSSFLSMSYAYKDGGQIVIRVSGKFTYDIICQTNVKEKLVSLINSTESTSLGIADLKVEISTEKPDFDEDSGIDEIIQNSK